jgi:hypothetical protein
MQAPVVERTFARGASQYAKTNPIATLTCRVASITLIQREPHVVYTPFLCNSNTLAANLYFRLNRIRIYGIP